MRLFIATPLPAAAEELQPMVERIRPILPPASWVRPSSIHLTWAFLGERDSSVVERLEASMNRILKSVPAVPIHLAGCGFFPTPRKARVAWARVEPAAELARIAAAVRKAVTDAHIEYDEKDFKAHLTICRPREPWPPDAIETFMREMSGLESRGVIDYVSLFQSELHPEGARHIELARVRLEKPETDIPG
jgi:2'-5' RNA ligase